MSVSPSLVVANCALPLTGPGRYAVEIDGGRFTRIVPMEEWSPTGSEQIDAAGRSVLPGFTDAHVHLVESGIELARCDLSTSRSREHALEMIGDYLERRPEVPWVVGRGWSLDHFTDAGTMRDDLDRVTGDRPAYISNKDGHSAWVNTAALQLAGVTDATENPTGGIIERDSSGRPSGLLHESAMLLVAELIPPLDEQTRFEGLIAGQEHFFSLGVTGWQEAIVGDFVPTTDVEDSYRRAIDTGALRGQVTANFWLPRVNPAAAIPGFLERSKVFENDDQFRIGAVKVMYDGVCETLTGAVSKPYLDGAEQPNFGITFFEHEELGPVLRELDRLGFDVHAHVIGDRAIDEVLTLIEDILATAPMRERRHQFAHLQLLSEDLISRMAVAGVIANIQPFWAQNDAQMEEMTLPFLAPELHTHQYAFRSLERAGVPLAFGSDWPVTTPNPMDWIHVAVNRSYPGDSAAALLPEEALSRESALRAATSGAAFAARQEDIRGEIREGLIADLVILASDLDDVPDDGLYAVRVDTTIARGEVVFSRENGEASKG